MIKKPLHQHININLNLTKTKLLIVAAIFSACTTNAIADTERVERIEVYRSNLPDATSCGTYCTIYDSATYIDDPFETMMLPVAWADVASPRCPNEANAKTVFDRALASYLSAPLATRGDPPGKHILPGQVFGDPAFSDPGWVKYDYNVINRERIGQSPNITRYSVHIHYMYNTQTGAVAQVRFKSTMQHACQGVPQSA